MNKTKTKTKDSMSSLLPLRPKKSNFGQDVDVLEYPDGSRLVRFLKSDLVCPHSYPAYRKLSFKKKVRIIPIKGSAVVWVDSVGTTIPNHYPEPHSVIEQRKMIALEANTSFRLTNHKQHEDSEVLILV